MGSTDMHLPQGAWDSHVHVVDEEAFPFPPDHSYRPKKASLDDLLAFSSSIGIDNVVLVALSIYSTDNRSLVDALRRIGPKARGVACIDPDTTTEDELKILHAAGVRGVRVNLKSQSQTPDKAAAINILRRQAEQIRPYGWALQVYFAMEQIELIADEIPKLGVPFVIDHMGSPRQDVPAKEQKGYKELMQLLRDRQAWVKISGTYRFAKLPDLQEFGRELISTAPTQVIWASDWPHTAGVEGNPGGDRMRHQDYRKVSDREWINVCKGWCDNSEAAMHRLWVDNPRRLWKSE